MSVLQDLLEYQKVDAQLREIEQAIAADDVRKKYLQAKKFMESAREKFEAQDKRAQDLSNLRDDISRRAEEIGKQIAEYSDLEEMVDEGGDVTFYKKNAQALLDRLRALKSELQKLTADIAATAEEYEKFKKQGALMQKQYKEYKEKYDSLKAEHADEVKAINEKLNALSQKLPEDTMKKYQQKRKEKIFPILVPLCGDRCVCGMDFPLAQQGKLAGGNVVECENCHRFVYKE